MADEEKECVVCKFFSKLFRPKKSSCCNMKIEEVAANEPLQPPQSQAKPSCGCEEQTKQGQK
jgi:hypothetical protein